MKTKIIYISGNEVFEMSEIRAAFDEVRSALGLDNDTILFGVPVDSDNALESKKTMTTLQNDTTAVLATECMTAPGEEIALSPICENETEVIQEQIPVSTIENTDNIIENKEEAEEESAIASEEPTEPQIENEEKIIPILSILAANTDPAQVNEAEDACAPTETTTDTISPSISDETTVVAESVQIETNAAEGTVIERITINDIVDEAPVATNTEKTLERLLESMTPLREDTEHNISDDTDAETVDTFDMDTNDTDATLAQLASEFVENEDKITNNANIEPQSKISKLKNILPFKKAKRDDGGLMGDLFGWAGIAANDDDFTMPGFFTGAKKQGA